MAELNKPQLVAETDDDGQVLHVWIAKPGWKSARPIKHTDLHSKLLAESEIHGASRQDVNAWIDKSVIVDERSL